MPLVSESTIRRQDRFMPLAHCRWLSRRFLVLCLGLCALNSATAFARECVILLHGLARTAESMNKLENELTKVNYYVVNIDYPSREHPIEFLSDLAVNQGLDSCEDAGAAPINFVTHSMGGILVRLYYRDNSTEGVNKVVMLGPPNQGSEVVDTLRNTPGFELLNGPAGLQLGTGDDSVPRQLGPVDFELGIIAGTKSINLILSSFLPNPDDGKVSVESTKVDGMRSFVALPVTHPLMMRNDQVISEVINFLKQGSFIGDASLVDDKHPE